MQTYDFSIIDFLSNGNAVLVSSETEYQNFQKRLTEIGFGGILRGKTWNEWLSLAKLNHPRENVNKLLFEYQNQKGITFGVSEQESEDWYGVPPLLVSNL